MPREESEDVAHRFEAGNLVLFKGVQGWYEGEIVQVGPASKYRVKPDDPENGYQVLVEIQEDTNAFIRRRPENLAPDPNLFCPPSPEDPHAYLYTGKTSNPISQDGYNLAVEFEKTDSVKKATVQPDGSIKIENKDGRVLTNATFLHETNKVCGVKQT
jgi:hypothetical protein